jgi:two-component system, OmpR family, alkaline phosphatase synthesis response regulator PhoP
MAKHVLVVDDEVHVRRLVELHLERAGYRVTTASDGQEALDKVAAEHPDLVILDVIMPRVDGFEVLRRLKGNPETAPIPVLMLTVRIWDSDIKEGWHSGAYAYLTKPFSPQELLQTVAQILASTVPTE